MCGSIRSPWFPLAPLGARIIDARGDRNHGLGTLVIRFGQGRWPCRIVRGASLSYIGHGGFVVPTCRFAHGSRMQQIVAVWLPARVRQIRTSPHCSRWPAGADEFQGRRRYRRRLAAHGVFALEGSECRHAESGRILKTAERTAFNCDNRVRSLRGGSKSETPIKSGGMVNERAGLSWKDSFAE